MRDNTFARSLDITDPTQPFILPVAGRKDADTTPTGMGVSTPGFSAQSARADHVHQLKVSPYGSSTVASGGTATINGYSGVVTITGLVIAAGASAFACSVNNTQVLSTNDAIVLSTPHNGGSVLQLTPSAVAPGSFRINVYSTNSISLTLVVNFVVFNLTKG